VIRRRDTATSNQNDLITSGNTSTLRMRHTFVYLENGVTTVTGGSVFWSAPRQEGYPFDYLALWSESSEMHSMGGQGTLEVSGTFFVPYANPFRFQGQSTVDQPQDAQFVTRRMHLQGGSYLEMRPDPADATAVPFAGVRLIR
jgi:hypothetical protein